MRSPDKMPRPWLPRRQENREAKRISLRERDPFYHTSRWKKESAAFRDQNPLCAICLQEGRTQPAEVTDHIIPKDRCQDPWDRSNWQSLCKRHHAAKGSRDKQHFKPKKK